MTRRDLIAVFSATAAWPITAGAQQPMPVIGYLSAGSAESDNIPGRLIAFLRGLEEMGYVERWNVESNIVGRSSGTIGSLAWRPIWFAVR
jgi:hypothetical protein